MVLKSVEIGSDFFAFLNKIKNINNKKTGGQNNRLFITQLF